MELLMLVSDFMVNSRLKILNGICMEFMECLNKDAKKKDTFCTSEVAMAVLIATFAKLLDTKYEFMHSVKI